MHRRTALAIVFVASAAILVLEIMAGRMLAPYLGVTLETFTGIIGTVLAGISLGAWLGGRLADRRDPGTLLGPLLVAGAITTLAAPAVVRWIGPSVSSGGPVEIVAAAFAAFFAPALVLSAVSPTIVKIQLRDLGRTGEVVGGFSAVSSAGAIFGTFVTGFVLVAAAPSRVVIAGVALVLLALGAFAWVRYGRRAGVSAGIAVIVAAAAAAGVAAAAPAPCEQETAYFCARIETDPDRPTGRALWLDTLRHSYVDLADPTYLDFRYTRVLADVIATLPPGPLRTLHVGGGGFTLPAYLDAVRPGSRHLVLELDGALVELSEEELGLERTARLEVVVGDARAGIAAAPSGEFDLVIGDAFGGRSVPWHLTTQEFLEEVDARLAPGGMYVMNLIDHPPHRFARAAAATVAEVFPHVLIVAPPDHLAGTAGGNMVLVGATSPVDRDALAANIASRDGDEAVLAGEAAREWFEGARILRDDLAPVDQLISRP